MRYGDRNTEDVCKICNTRLGAHHSIDLACPMPNSKEFSKLSTFAGNESLARMKRHTDTVASARGDNPAGAGLQEALGLPTDNAARKNIPVYTGFVKYFPRAIAAVAELSRIANEQHHPGSPVHWDKSKSRDELDSFMRHMLDEALDVPVDTDKVLHATKMAWRSMANLERILDTQAAK